MLQDQTEESGSYRGHHRDEELGAVGSWSGVGHAECVRPVVSQAGVELILKLSAPDALSPHPRTSGVSGLDHKTLRRNRKRLHTCTRSSVLCSELNTEDLMRLVPQADTDVTSGVLWRYRTLEQVLHTQRDVIREECTP